MKSLPALDFDFNTDAYEVPASAHVQDLVRTQTPGALEECFHKHLRGQLAFAIGGACTCYTPNAVWTILPNQAFWIPAGLPHRVFHTEGASSGYLYLEPHHFKTYKNICSLDVPLYAIHGLMHIAESEQGSGLPFHKDKLLKLIIEEVLHQTPKPLYMLPNPADERLKIIQAGMRENSTRKFSLEDWADFFNVSSKTLSRLIQKDLGLTFNQWRVREQCVRAIELLSKDKTIDWIASELGYSMTSSFSSMFKRELGLSPQTYRQKVLKQR